MLLKRKGMYIYVYTWLGVPTLRHSRKSTLVSESSVGSRGSKVSQVEVSEVPFWVPTPRLCSKNEDDILHLKWKCRLHLTVCFFMESLRHLELFSGIAHELIEFSRTKLTEILTRQSRNKRQYSNWCCRVSICFSGGCYPFTSLACVSCAYISLVDPDILFPIVCFVSTWTNTWWVSLETGAEASQETVTSA